MRAITPSYSEQTSGRGGGGGGGVGGWGGEGRGKALQDDLVELAAVHGEDGAEDGVVRDEGLACGGEALLVDDAGDVVG